MNREVKESVTHTSLTYQWLRGRRMMSGKRQQTQNLDEWAQWGGLLYLVKSDAYSCVWSSEVVSSGSGGWRHENVKAHLCDAPPGCHLSYVVFANTWPSPWVGVVCKILAVVFFFMQHSLFFLNRFKRIYCKFLLCPSLLLWQKHTNTHMFNRRILGKRDVNFTVIFLVRLFILYNKIVLAFQ